jgi:hypothetical protein
VARWSALENNARSGAPFLDSQSIDCSEWRIGAFSIRNIVLAHHRKVAWHGQAAAPGLVDNRDCPLSNWGQVKDYHDGLLQPGLVDLGRSVPADNRWTADSSNQSQEHYNAESN